MKTDSDLDRIAQAVRDSCQLIDPDYPRTRRKLLRDIQIDVLREARGLVERAGDDDLGHAFVLAELDKLIRNLELK